MDNEKLTQSKQEGIIKKMLSNRKALVILLIIGLVILTFGTSLAFFYYSRIAGRTTITSGDIEFSFIEGDSAGLISAFPVSDAVGAADTSGEYTFDVRLASSSKLVSAKYIVSLISNNDGEKNFNNEHIKYNLQRNGEFVVGSATKGELLSTIEGFEQGYSNGEGIVVFNKEIEANTTDTYILRIWIDENVNYSNTINGQDEQTSVGKFNSYTYSLKAKVEASVENVYGYGFEKNVTLDANGGEVDISSITVLYGGTYENLPTPTRVGYVFAGWYNAQTGGEPVTSDTYYKTVEANKLYARWSKDKFTLTVNPNEGTYDESTSEKNYILEYLDEMQINDPTRVGYTFTGWKLAGSGSSIDGKSFKMGHENAILTATWKVNEYTLKINPNGGIWNSSGEEQTFKLNYNGTKEIDNPTRDGYTFTGWEIEGKNANLNSTTFTIGDGDATLKATWKVNNYKYITKHYQQNVTADGYTLVSGDTVEDNAEFGSKVTPPVKTYLGFTSPSTKTLTITSNELNNLVEYQYTRNKYNLTVNPNGGKYNNTTNNTVTTMYYGATSTIENPTRTGYTFDNWTTSSGNLNDKVFTMGNSNATLTANWTANKYIVTYDANGGTTPKVNDEVTYNSTYVSLPTPTREGYTFNGWFTEKDGGEQITETTTVKTASDHSIYAHWNINSYTLTVKPNNGTWNNSTASQNFTLNYSEEKVISLPTRVGYTFNGWTLNGTGSVMSSLTENSTFKMGTSDATLTANWNINNYKLTVNPNGGTWNSSDASQDFTLNYNAEKEIEEPVRDGYTFTGWEVTGTNASLNSTTFKIGESDATLKATWEINTYKYITKHYQQNVTATGYTLVNGDTLESTADFGTQVTPPVKTYTGFTSPSPKTLTITSTEANNLVEYQYTRNKYNLTVNPNGGKYNNTTSNTTISMYYGATQAIPNPTMTGYTFVNWTVSSGILSDKVFTMGASNATLTANWTADKYTITFNANNGSVTTSTKQVTYDSVYGELPTPTRNGYTFLGWFTAQTGGEQVESDTKVTITANQTLYAHWISSDAAVITYSNPEYTDCTTLECSLNELYNKLNNLD